MLRLRIATRTAALLTFLLTLFSSASLMAAEIEIPAAANEGLDPNSMVDDIGFRGVVPISHPGRLYPATNDFPTGPEVGELFPDFSLRNQHGELVNFQESRGGSKAVVDFFRSAVW